MDQKRNGCVILLLVLVGVVAVNCENLVFNVKHKYGGRKGSILNELKAHDTRRHGRMLNAIDFRLGGNGLPTDAALYYTKLSIGTPPKDYHVQVDTGSDILWVNCAGCEGCPTKSNLGIDLMLYDLKASLTGKPVLCDGDFCDLNDPFDSDCRVGMPCDYKVQYGDGTSTTGYFVEDIIQFDQVSGDLKTTSMNGSISFGCSSKLTKEDSPSQPVDGILGFGRQDTSLISQLAAAGKVTRIFAHCLDGKNGGGIFTIGPVVHPKVNSTPLIPDAPHYAIDMKAIEVGGVALDIPKSLFDSGSSITIIDSGTTLAYLPSVIFSALITKITERQPDLNIRVVDGSFHCFDYSGKIDDGFPVVTFKFADSVSLTVYPHDYLFQVDESKFCIGWQDNGVLSNDGQEIILLGDLAISNKLIVYDIENKTIGWTEHDCSSTIKLKYENSSSEFAVASHNISSSVSIVDSRKVFTFFLLIICILYTLLK